MSRHHQETQDWQRNPTPDGAGAARLFDLHGYTVTCLDVSEREEESEVVREHRVQSNAVQPPRKREQPARDAFDLAAAASDRLLQRAVEAEDTAPGKLDAFVKALQSAIEHPAVEGSPPAVPAAMSSFEALPLLEARVRAVIDGWRHHVRRIIRLGIRRGEFRPSARPEQVASIVVGTMEGAMFLHRLYGDASHVDRSVAYLHKYFESEVHA